MCVLGASSQHSLHAFLRALPAPNTEENEVVRLEVAQKRLSADGSGWGLRVIDRILFLS